MRRSVTFGIVTTLSLALILWLALHFQRPIGTPGASIDTDVSRLPFFAMRSLSRMLAAYALSLIFSLAYGYAAATSKRAERILLPVLDILQSIPVIGFFPVAIVFFVAAAPGILGLELASIFLIFTGMAWNMAFGVYEGLTTIPVDMLEAAQSFGVRGRLKMSRLLFPAVIPKLVYNSVVSWAAGWYFLIACEIITAGGAEQTLPGIGSFLKHTSDEGRFSENLVGLAALVGIVVALDLLVWRPLSSYAERFRYEFSASRAQDGNAVLEFWLRSRLGSSVRAGAAAIGRVLALPIVLAARAFERPVLGRVLRKLLSAAGVIALAWLLWALARGIWQLVVSPWPADARRIPLAVLASTMRLAVAYAITVAWTVPVAIWAGSRRKVARIVTPVAEIGASVPAIALFPLMVVLLIRYIGVNGAAVLLILTGMQWYVLFNLLAGVSSIPEDLKEATRSLGLPWRQRIAKLVLPAIAPSLVTGSITGWGGGWNALIVSEQVKYAKVTYKSFGIGSMLDDATFEGKGDPIMLGLCLVAMVITIVAINRLVWRRFYGYVSERFRIDY